MGLDVNLPREIGARRMVHFGAFEADLQAGELRKYGVRIKVADQPFRVLELLLERPGRLLAREELKQHLWPVDTYVDFDRGLNAAVKILRGALGDSPRNPRFIETVPKRGYRFVAPAKPAPRIHGTAEETPRDETASGASAPSQPAAGGAGTRQGIWARPAMALAALFALGLFALLWVTTLPYGGSPVEAGPVRLRVRPLATAPARASYPALSPDGKSIAFSWNGGEDSAEPKNWDIYIQAIDGGAPVRVTAAPGRAVSPSWSPDGRFIAFLRDWPAPAPGGYVASLRDGSETRLMGFDYGPASWTPDGKWLLAFDEDAKVVAISMQTRKRRKFTAHTVAWWEQDVAVSPDGNTVAFARCLAVSSCDVYVIPIEGGQPRRLTFDRGSMAGLAWTPDSREIIYALDGRLYRLPADGRTGALAVELVSREPLRGQMSLPTLARFPSNGSTRVLFQHRTRDVDIWLTEISGDSATGMAENRRKLIDSPGEDRWPQFSPDGRRIAFVSTRAGSGGALWIADRDGSNPRQLTPAAFRVDRGLDSGPPAWSHDGSQIAFRASTPSDKAYHIYRIPAEGGIPRVVTYGEDESKPAWSRDGLWIYFFSNQSGQPEIWKAPFSGGGPAVPLNETLSVSYAESPDGRFVYFCGVEKPGVPYNSLFRVPVEGGHRERLLHPFNADILDFRGDGLYFLDLHDPEGPRGSLLAFKMLDPESGQVAEVGRVRDPMDGGVHHFSLSPDGRSILTSNVASSKKELMLVENFR